jgi:hypothetical protein
VITTLTNLEVEMDRALNQIRNGIRALQEEKNTAEPAASS